jgi:hypothetical protein
MTGKDRIMIYGPKDDGTYVIEFRMVAAAARWPSPESRQRNNGMGSRSLSRRGAFGSRWHLE